jgi:hypothetical protein
MEIPFFK